MILCETMNDIQGKNMFDLDRIQKLRQRNLTVAETPYQILIETAGVCNRKCGFCGIKKNNNGVMDFDLYKKIIDDITDARILQLSHIGEPLLQPRLLDMIKYARGKHPRCQINIISNFDIIATNQCPGIHTPFPGNTYLLEMFSSGLNNYIVDFYSEVVKQKFISIVQSEKTNLTSMGVDIVDFCKTKYSPHTYNGDKKKAIVYMDKIHNEESHSGFEKNKSNRVKLHSWAGMLSEANMEKFIGTFIEDFPKRKVCIAPLRHMAINWEGHIELCCVSVGATERFLNIKDISVNEAWQSKQLNAVRFALKQGRRDLIPTCFFCDRMSFRTGLYGYAGETFSLDELLDTYKHMFQIPKDEVIYENFIKYMDYRPGVIPDYIKQLL